MNPKDSPTASGELTEDDIEAILIQHPITPRWPVRFARSIEAEVRSRLAAATPVVPPSGWKLVPIEPTKEMCIAAVKFANGNAVYKNVAPAALEIEEGIYGETYAAMLAASPSPRTPEQPASGLCVRCHKQPGDRVVIGTGWICAGCATDDEREL